MTRRSFSSNAFFRLCPQVETRATRLRPFGRREEPGVEGQAFAIYHTYVHICIDRREAHGTHDYHGPPDLKLKAKREAKSLGITFGEYIRRALTLMLQKSELTNADSLFENDTVYSGSAPHDLSENHDRHLYGGKQ